MFWTKFFGDLYDLSCISTSLIANPSHILIGTTILSTFFGKMWVFDISMDNFSDYYKLEFSLHSFSIERGIVLSLLMVIVCYNFSSIASMSGYFGENSLSESINTFLRLG